MVKFKSSPGRPNQPGRSWEFEKNHFAAPRILLDKSLRALNEIPDECDQCPSVLENCTDIGYISLKLFSPQCNDQVDSAPLLIIFLLRLVIQNQILTLPKDQRT